MLPIVVPTRPAKIPATNQLDESTGMHMTGIVQQLDLAYEWQRQPVPILHGFPLRAVIPDFGGWTWVKWLVGIEVE